MARREKWENCWRGKKRSRDKRKMLLFAASSLPSSAEWGSYLCGALLTQHAHRQSWQCEDTHTGMKAGTSRGEARMHAGEWEQITGSEERGHADQTLAGPSPPPQQPRNNRPSEQCRAINQRRSCQRIKQTVWSQFQVNGGPQTPRGSTRGWRGALISALHYKETQALLQTPPCWHSQQHSQQQPSCTPSQPHCEKLLIGEKNKKKNFQRNSREVDALVTSQHNFLQKINK